MSSAESRILQWPDGSVYRITQSTEDTGGERQEMEFELPGPRLGSSATLSAGEAASVPPGAVHTFRTRDEPVRVRNVHRPPLDFEPYVKSLCQAANQHELGDLTSLKSLSWSPSSFTNIRRARELQVAP